jgi:hypothetical protein
MINRYIRTNRDYYVEKTERSIWSIQEEEKINGEEKFEERQIYNATKEYKKCYKMIKHLIK